MYFNVVVEMSGSNATRLYLLMLQCHLTLVAMVNMATHAMKNAHKETTQETLEWHRTTHHYLHTGKGTAKLPHCSWSVGGVLISLSKAVSPLEKIPLSSVIHGYCDARVLQLPPQHMPDCQYQVILLGNRGTYR